MAPQSQQQLSPAFSGGNHNAPFLSGAVPAHRPVQSPSADGPEPGGVEDLSSAVRTPLGLPTAQHLGLQHNRISSYGEDGQNGGPADPLGEWNLSLPAL